MRKLLVLSIVVLALVVSTGAISAQVPGPGGPYNSGFTIQNLETAAASCVFSLYNSSGVVAYSSSAISVPASGSYFVYVGNLSAASGQYSAVISCDRQVTAIANTTSASNAASYSGVGESEVATTVYAPGLYKNYFGYNSNLVAQNTTSSSINVTLQVFAPGSSTPVQTFGPVSVPAYASTSFDQAAQLTSNGLFSGKVIATGNVAVVVNIWNTVGQFFSYNGFKSGSTQAFVPVLMNNYFGFNTALTVQNLLSSSTTVTVTYSTGQQSVKTVAGSSAQLFYTPNEGVSAGFLGSAKVQAAPGGSIVALVNESSNTNRAASYNGFSSGNTTARAPIVLKRYFGYSTSITCQNVGTSSTNITVNYSNGATQSANNVPANGTTLFYQPNVAGLPDAFNGSATITSSSQGIVCVVNENQVDNAAAQDWLLAYNAGQQ